MSIPFHAPSGSLFRYQSPILRHPVSIAVAYAFLLGAIGCQSNLPKVAQDEPPAVPVSQPVQREVTDYVVFTGQTKAVHSNDIIPQVTGYLVQMPFEEGAEVKKGDLLFEVDPRPYKAQLDQALGQVDLYKAQLKLAKVNLARSRAIDAASPGTVSQQQFDQGQAVVDEAAARVDAAERSMELYRLNYDFTKVVSPIDGQSSRYYKTLGNLVNQDQTLLTTVVSVDPMHVYFEMDEPTLLRYRATVAERSPEARGDRVKMPVFMGLQGEDGFPHEGTINFGKQPEQSDDGNDSGAWYLPEPEAEGRPPTLIARHVCEYPPADRASSPSTPGSRSGHRVRSGVKVRLCARRGKQSSGSPGQDRRAGRRRLAGD